MKAAPTTPPRAAAAFERMDDDAVQAQAAILLSVGAQLRGDRAAVHGRSAAAAQPTDMFTAEVLDEFPLPRLAPAARRISGRTALKERHAVTALTTAATPAKLSRMADDLYKTRSTTAAAALAYAALRHRHPLVRVAAAYAALAVTTETTDAYDVLVTGTRHRDELIRDVAATALARYRPDDPVLRRRIGKQRRPTRRPANTSTLVHGTWAANGTWWRPGGDFFKYVDQNVWSDLYKQSDFYRWSGGYSTGARDQGADLLVDWINAKKAKDLSLMTHSHGGSVAMLASWLGVTFGEVVLLSCPVHPWTYSMNFGAVQKVVSVRVKLDLVLLADGSGSQFTDSRYNEHVLPIWFNHSATHDPAVWTSHNIPAML